MESPRIKHTSKGERTREHLLDTALRLFVEQGYEATTMRAIAAAADSSLGLTYRYFASKEELVLALYERLSEEMLAEVADLPRGSVAHRFEAAMRRKLALLTPYREALGALFAAAMNPRSPIAVLGSSSAEFRQHGLSIFYEVIAGATDAPRPRQARQLATLLYTAYLSLVLFWLNDRTPEMRSTTELLAISRNALTLSRPLLVLPPTARLLTRLVRAIEPVFGALPEDLPTRHSGQDSTAAADRTRP
jgi:AcrR family transcriptional regulator